VERARGRVRHRDVGGALTGNRDDDPLGDRLADLGARAARFDAFLDQLRAGDPSFAEASALYPGDMDEWQAAVYLLTGSDVLWRRFGAAVLDRRSIGPVIDALATPARAWSHSETLLMRWAAHFWDVTRHDAGGFPWSFEEFYFQRWITSCHLRKHVPPALHLT
jgi:hypothetical protein